MRLSLSGARACADGSVSIWWRNHTLGLHTTHHHDQFCALAGSECLRIELPAGSENDIPAYCLPWFSEWDLIRFVPRQRFYVYKCRPPRYVFVSEPRRTRREATALAALMREEDETSVGCGPLRCVVIRARSRSSADRTLSRLLKRIAK